MIIGNTNSNLLHYCILQPTNRNMLLSAVHKEGDEEKLHLLMVDPHIPAGAKLY